MKKLFLLFIAVVSLWPCSAAERIAAKYAYKASDTNGVLLVEGTFNLTVISSNRIRGDWTFHKVKAGAKVGRQIGSGKIMGRIERDTITLDLNPGWADNNVVLHGRITSTNLTGTWGYYGFAGKLNGGKFEAMKK